MMISVAEADTFRRDSVALNETLFEKLVLSGPPQRSPSLPLNEPPGPGVPLPEPPPCSDVRQPLESPGELPRSTLLRTYLVKTSPNESTSSQRFPWLSGMPNSKLRPAL